MRSVRGFSLIELVIVVLIIGVISAIAVPRLSRGSEGARVNAFVKEINTFAMLIEQYELETGSDVTDSSTGRFPSEMKGYLHDNSWQGQTPLGGEWDIEADDNGVGLAVGVHYRVGDADLASLQQVDAILDDGSLSSGVFRKIAAGRFYLVLEE